MQDIKQIKDCKPLNFLNQFDFVCKYNKNYNRTHDCDNYLVEIKKEILICLERSNTKIEMLQSQNKELRNIMETQSQNMNSADQKLNKLLMDNQKLKDGQCHDVLGLLKHSKYILKDDAVGRLELIGFLHDFQNIQQNIETYKYQIENKEPVNIKEIVKEAFFPKIKMSFSEKENPLKIVDELENNLLTLKKEMLYLQQNTDLSKLNNRQRDVCGNHMLRILSQLSFQDQIQSKSAQIKNEQRGEYIYFQKLLILTKQLKDLDLKDFSALCNNKTQQSDEQCFKIARSITQIIDEYSKNKDQSQERYKNSNAFMKFGKEVEVSQAQIFAIQNKVSQIEIQAEKQMSLEFIPSNKIQKKAESIFPKAIHFAERNSIVPNFDESGEIIIQIPHLINSQHEFPKLNEQPIQFKPTALITNNSSLEFYDHPRRNQTEHQSPKVQFVNLKGKKEETAMRDLLQKKKNDEEFEKQVKHITDKVIHDMRLSK